MSKEQWDSLVERLNRPNEKKKKTIEEILASREEELKRETTFKPVINKKSRALATQFTVPMDNRIESFLEDKKRKIERMREQLEAAEMSQVTFKPQIEKTSKRTPKQRDVENLMEWVSLKMKYCRQFNFVNSRIAESTEERED